jgi:hypothetical protein
LRRTAVVGAERLANRCAIVARELFSERHVPSRRGSVRGPARFAGHLASGHRAPPHIVGCGPLRRRFAPVCGSPTYGSPGCDSPQLCQSEAVASHEPLLSSRLQCHRCQ